MKTTTRIIDEGKGPLGLPNRLIEVEGITQDDIRGIVGFLAERGCGAWVGRSVCGALVEWVVFGTNYVMFATYRAVPGHGDRPVMAALCDRHAGTIQAVTRDTASKIWVSQAKEYRKFCELRGEDHDRTMIFARPDDAVLGR